MRYVIRADASPTIGSGHVMRSSAIAEELIARGEKVVFVGQISNLSWVTERIMDLGFIEIYNNPLDFTSKSDTDVLILDSYEISENDPSIARSKWFQIIAVVDELTPNYFCNLRIHPGLDASWIGNSTIPIIAGARFIPFRAKLSQQLVAANQIGNTLKIAVVAGGSDPYQLVLEIAKILSRVPRDFEVLLFSNASFQEGLDSRFKFIEIGLLLDELTQSVDLVLTTSSTSSLEFIARGLCVGVACAVDNQRQYYDSLEHVGAAAQIGIRNSSGKWELKEEVILNLVTSPELRKKIVSNSVGLIDFNGASRIADAIQAL